MSDLTQNYTEDQDWDTEIKPQGGLFEINFKEIWRYRDLLVLFIKRDLVTVYKQTILGPAWFVIQPIFTTIMYVFIFGEVAGISTGTIPQPLFYLSGIALWNYFSTCLNKTSSTFITNQGIFGKVYFPRLIIPLSVITSNLLRFSIQMLLLTAVYLFYVIYVGLPIRPNAYLLLFPLLVIMMAGISLGIGILISSLTTKYRDLSMFFSFFIGLWMYATPVIYPLNMVESRTPWMVDILQINPLTPIFETFKYGAFGEGVFTWGGLAYSFVFMLVLLGVGIVVFNRVQRSFMDTV